MKTIRIKIYRFEELTEDAQQKAIENLSHINVDYDWRESTYNDAGNIGLKLTGFGLDRNKHAEGEFILSANEVAQNIFNNHGAMCDTFKTSESFMEKWQPVFSAYMETEEGENVLQEIEDEYLNDLLSDYATMLQNESEYLQSDEAIKEMILANEYEFTIDGKQY